MNHGHCQGGPYDGRPIAHPEPTMRVAINKHTNKSPPSVLGGDDYKFGLYRWNGKNWTWEAPVETKSAT